MRNSVFHVTWECKMKYVIITRLIYPLNYKALWQGVHFYRNMWITGSCKKFISGRVRKTAKLAKFKVSKKTTETFNGSTTTTTTTTTTATNTNSLQNQTASDQQSYARSSLITVYSRPPSLHPLKKFISLKSFLRHLPIPFGDDLL